VFLSAQNVRPFRFQPEVHRFVSEEDYQSYTKRVKPRVGDVLVTRVGAGIGEAAVIDTHLDFAFYVSIGLIRPIAGLVNPDYLALWPNSPLGRSSTRRNTYGKGVSQGNLNLSLLRQLVVSVPPLKEQGRIVERAVCLMKGCDDLETLLVKRGDHADTLAQAVANAIVNGKPHETP
jgi:type I restriction enzyme S subunit